MDRAEIEDIARRSMAQRRDHVAREPGFILYHGRRTAQIALKLAAEIGADVDPDLLYTAALFHDVGKGRHPHNEAGAAIAQELLGAVCAPAALDRICEIIRLHNQRKQPNDYSVETRLVQDADVLDHFGPIGPWLHFYWSARHDETIDDALGHFFSEERHRHCDELRTLLNLPASVEVYDRRLEFERRYFDELDRVQRGGL